MSDFLTRLAERALDVAPVVQPLVAPRFALEPGSHPPHPVWADEAVWSDEAPSLDAASEAQASPSYEAPLPRGATAARSGVSSGYTMIEHSGPRDNVDPAGSGSTRGGVDETRLTGASQGPPPELRTAESVSEQASPRPIGDPAARNRPLSDARTDTHKPGAREQAEPYPARPDSARPGVDAASSSGAQTPLPDPSQAEGVPIQASPRTVVPLAGRRESPRPGPSEDAQAAPVKQEDSSNPASPPVGSNPAGDTLPTRDVAKSPAGETTASQQTDQEGPYPATPVRANRTSPAPGSKPTFEPGPGRDGETTSATPPAPSSGSPHPPRSPKDVSDKAELLSADTHAGGERRTSLPSRGVPNERGGEPRARAHPATPTPPELPEITPKVAPKMRRSEVDDLSQRGSRMSSSPSLEASQPTVRVNIGRVEVRAVMPPPAPPQQQTAPPTKLSLDDYLRSRGRGRR